MQASLKLVLEPIFEADFLPCSYGFRPNRRAHDAVAEVRLLTSKKYEWIVEGDIKACFDEISHTALMERVRTRVGDKHVLALVKAFLKAGILSEDGLCGTTTLAPRRVRSFRRCSATSRSRSWTSTSPRRREAPELISTSAGGVGAEVCPTIGWSGTRTTGA
ncbi:reverse transcriptase domain-containing protein [Streptomyces sp. NPDC004647]|uniref:reverse transcriptase domain-containing protein n=1 Tax=Streptomyces sp. NPDC004647 TaxID=3154671 RepID=UPI0033A16840